MGFIIGQRLGQSLPQGRRVPPRKVGAKQAVIGVIIADVDRLAVGRKRDQPIAAPAVNVHQQAGQILEADRAVAAHIEDPAVALIVGRRDQARLHDIIDIGEVPPLGAVPVDLDRLALDELADPPAQEGLPGVPHPHARAVRIGQAQGAGADAIDVVIDDVVPLPRRLVDAVDVDGAHQMPLIHRQVVRHPVDLARAGIHDLDAGIVLAAGFQDRELGAAVDVQVGVRIGHRIQVAGLPREVEEIILAAHQVAEAIDIPHVSDVDPHARFNAAEVKEVAPVFRDERVDHKHLSTQAHEPVRQRRADEAQPAGDDDLAPGKR